MPQPNSHRTDLLACRSPRPSPPTHPALLKRAWQQIKLDIDETGIDRQELLSWSIQTLMAAAGQAMQQKNPGAVVACIRQLDHMTGTGYNSHRGNGMRRY